MKKRLWKSTAGLLTAAMVLGLAAVPAPVTVSAATEHWNDASEEGTKWTNWKTRWETQKDNMEYVSLTPGETEEEMNFAWYSQSTGTSVVGVSTNSDLSNAKYFYNSTQEAVPDTEYYSNKVTIKGLEENTTYYYQVMVEKEDGSYDSQDVQSFETGSFTNYSFLYVGDPQIGACKGQTDSTGTELKKTGSDTTEALAARNDAYNWNETLNEATENHDVSFMVSAGDQVNYGDSEIEYSGYLGADALTSLPVATTIGNHDSGNAKYSLHFNNPNNQDDADSSYNEGRTAAGTDYYFTYGEVLFIVLDTNNYNCATHENVIKKAVEENPDVTWKIVTFHQDIYGSGYDHSDSDGIVLRTQLTPIMDKYDIDVVLQGHDHTYSRTYQITSDGAEHTAYDASSYRSESAEEYETQNECYSIDSDTVSGTVVNPEGTVYLEANSATGSKFYNLIATKQDYISERSQTWTPTYAVIDVTENSLTMTTYDVTTGEIVDGGSSYTIVKDDDIEAQTITGTASYEKTVGDAAFKLDAETNGNGKLTYESDNEDVAVVSKSGKVTVTGEGTAVITVTAAETGNYTKATFQVTVTVKAAAEKKEQTVTGTSAYTKTTADEGFKLDAKTDGDGKLSYESDNEDVAVVSSKGRVEIVGAGTATITVTAAETDTCKAASFTVTLTVTEAETTAPAVEAKTQKITGTSSYKKTHGAKSFTLDAKTNGDGKLTYKSSDTKVVKVNSAGKVTVKGIGKATITVTAAATDNYKKATKKITVKVSPKKLSVSVAAGSKKQMKVSWKKDSKVDGYKVVVATNKSFTKNVNTYTIKSNKTVSKKISGLKKGTKYYVKVRSYKKVDGTTWYSAYSKVKSYTCKK